MDFFTIGLVSIGVSVVAWASFSQGERAERRRVRRLLHGSVRPRGYEPRLADNSEVMNAVAVQVTDEGGYQYVFTGDRVLVAEAMRAAAEGVSPLPL